MGSLALIAWLMREPVDEKVDPIAPVAYAVDAEEPIHESFPYDLALVRTNVTGASVHVDGMKTCETPCEIKVPVGDGRTHEIRLVKPGYATITHNWRPKSVSEPLPALPDMKPL